MFGITKLRNNEPGSHVNCYSRKRFIYGACKNPLDEVKKGQNIPRVIYKLPDFGSAHFVYQWRHKQGVAYIWCIDGRYNLFISCSYPNNLQRSTCSVYCAFSNIECIVCCDVMTKCLPIKCCTINRINLGSLSQKLKVITSVASSFMKKKKTWSCTFYKCNRLLIIKGEIRSWSNLISEERVKFSEQNSKNLM